MPLEETGQFLLRFIFIFVVRKRLSESLRHDHFGYADLGVDGTAFGREVGDIALRGGVGIADQTGRQVRGDVLGIIAGAGEIEQGGGAITTSGSQAFTSGAASSVSQSATTILDRLIQIPPTITIREGHRVKVYFTQDMLLPAYTNHTIPQTF